MRIGELEPAAKARWNEFVRTAATGTFFHLAEWADVLADTFAFPVRYLYAESGPDIVGVLPLVEVRSLLFGRTLVSTPFCVYGGALAVDDEVAAALEDAAARLAAERRVDYLELRNLARRRPDWPASDLYVTFRKPISDDDDENMKAIPRKQRAMVRKGIQAGLDAQTDDDIERFFPIYATSVRNHGTPIFARRFFAALKRVFADDCEITVVCEGGRAISSVMSFRFRDEVLPYYGGGLARAREVKAFDFMYWEVMRRAAARGVRCYDYGRSKRGTGSYSFKTNWGFEPSPLHYQYKLVKASRLPQKNPMNAKYQPFIEMWKRLPLPIANAIGPIISRGLG